MTKATRTNIDAHLAIMRGLEIGLAAGLTDPGELTTEVHKALHRAGVGFKAAPQLATLP